MGDAPVYQARWEPPRPYGYPVALDGMGTIAAPLLASVSIALIAAVLAVASFPHGNVVLLLLVLAGAAFTATVECSFMARQYAVTPNELEGWWPDYETSGRRMMLRREQRYFMSRFRFWAKRARFGYNTGVLALSFGVVVLLVPEGHVSGARWCVIALAAAAYFAEVAWIVVTLHHDEKPQLSAVDPEPPLGSS